jgi:hypothetical protein
MRIHNVYRYPDGIPHWIQQVDLKHDSRNINSFANNSIEPLVHMD